jgi:cytosine/adenosine deaminase-related metal-dependent hydrolase
MTEARPILIQDARILSMVDGSAEVRGDVLVSGGQIAAVGAFDTPPEAEIVNAQGAILLPGFVDSHRHVWQTQLRTTAGDWSLYDYLVRMRMTYSAFYGPEDVYLGNYVGALEALHAGVTTVVDHCHILNSPDHTDEAIRGLTEAGIRAVFCYGLFANPKSHVPFVVDPDMSWRYHDARRLRTGPLASADHRILLGLAPHEPEATPFDISAGDVRFAREIAAHVISCHVAMGAYDQNHQFVRRLHNDGLLDSQFLFVHGSRLTDDELDMIAHAGAGISSTPETELQMGMGYPVAMRARRAGVHASLGVDIVSNYSGDLFTQMRMMAQSARAQAHAVLAARGEAPRRVGVSAREILRLATLGGAEAIGLSHRIGTIEPGKQADLILIRTDSIGMVPATDAVGAVVFNAKADDVGMVMIEGRWMKRDGVLVGTNWPVIATRLERSADRILSLADQVDLRIPTAVVDRYFGNLT